MNNFKGWTACLVIGVVVPVLAQHGAGGHVGGPGHMAGNRAMSHREDAHGNRETTTGAENKSVSERLSDNKKLAAKLQTFLPKGTNLQTASSGFKNLGQFVAAVHVSHNLGIPFDQLKSKMVGPPAESLGKAIQQLKPSAHAKTERKKAEKQAQHDLKESEEES